MAEGNALGLAFLTVFHNVAVINDDDLDNDVVIVELCEVSHLANREGVGASERVDGVGAAGRHGAARAGGRAGEVADDDDA